MPKFTIDRRIELDAAHRVPDHKSKCFNVHGHRYAVEALVSSEILHDLGEQKGMTLDFGFLKQIMMEIIHDPCDHGLILYHEDPLLKEILGDEQVYQEVTSAAKEWGQVRYLKPPFYKLYVIDDVPTAEVLAEHWFRRLAPGVATLSDGLARLQAIRVYETPNCSATYFRPKFPGAKKQESESASPQE